MPIVHLEATPDVKAMASKVFPSYRGRKFKLDNSGRAVNVTSYWDGGSRDYYAMIDLGTDRRLDVPQNGTWFDGGPIAPDGVTVPPGYMLAEHSIFMGKDYGITFYVNPDTAVGFLPTPETLTADEHNVLTSTASWKNTYQGVGNYRFIESRRNTGITADRWEAAKAALIGRKLLNKAGAITVSGRNAIGSSY